MRLIWIGIPDIQPKAAPSQTRIPEVLTQAIINWAVLAASEGDNMKRVGIIGSGNVGSNSAFFIAENRTASVVLIDVKEGLSVGKALDISEAGPIRSYDTEIRGENDIEKIRGSDIVVIATGRVRAPEQSRDELYRDNAPLAVQICKDIKRLTPEAVVINVMEPVDMITLLAQKILGFDRMRVLGVGGLLSSTRLRFLVSKSLGVSSRQVSGMVIGPHRPRMVILRDTVRVSGIPVEKLLTRDQFDAIADEVRKAGDTILQMAQRSTSYYAPSAAIAALVEAIARNTKVILPVSIKLQGEFGLDDIAVSVPACIGAKGVDHIMSIKMSAAEMEEFLSAADELRASLKRVAG
jgi:malate dehydrogenase